MSYNAFYILYNLQQRNYSNYCEGQHQQKLMILRGEYCIE